MNDDTAAKTDPRPTRDQSAEMDVPRERSNPDRSKPGGWTFGLIDLLILTTAIAVWTPYFIHAPDNASLATEVSSMRVWAG
ncbi:MAG: hypothetical protein AAFN70_13845, partial [Planctomycetota bacterium]